MDTTVVLLALAAIGACFFRTSLVFRIVLAVIFVWIALMRYAPRACLFISGICVGLFIFYRVFDSLRSGVIEIRVYSRVSIYDRNNNPVEFWFFILLSGFIGTISFIASAYGSFH